MDARTVISKDAIYATHHTTWQLIEYATHAPLIAKHVIIHLPVDASHAILATILMVHSVWAAPYHNIPMQSDAVPT